MSPTIPERLAVVETKVGEIQNAQGEIGAKVNAIYDHMVADKANRKLTAKFFGGIAGVVGVAAALREFFH
jgi:hypothetical protein